MYCLAKTTNEKYLVISSTNVRRKKKKFFIKHHGREYEANIIVRSDKQEDLLKIASNLTENIPKLMIERISKFQITQYSRENIYSSSNISNDQNTDSKIDNGKVFDVKSTEINKSSVVKNSWTNYKILPVQIETAIDDGHHNDLRLSSNKNENLLSIILEEHNYSNRCDSLNKKMFSNSDNSSLSKAPICTDMISKVKDSKQAKPYILINNIDSKDVRNDDTNPNLEELNIKSKEKIENAIEFKVYDDKIMTTFSASNDNDKDEIDLIAPNCDQNLVPTCIVYDDIKSRENQPKEDMDSKCFENLNKIKNECSNQSSINVPKLTITSFVEGNFLPICNGFIKKIKVPEVPNSTFDELPIIIAETPVINKDEQKISFDSSINEEHQLSAILNDQDYLYICDTVDQLNLNSNNFFQDSTDESDLYQKTDTLQVDSKIDIDKDAEKYSEACDTDHNELNHETRIIIQNENDQNENNYSDDDAESSDSHISELEELEDLENTDDVEDDDTMRNNRNTSTNSNYNLSLVEKPLNYKCDFDIRQNNDQSLNNIDVSVPTLFDNSRLSSSTLNQSKNDSSYVPEPDSSLNETHENRSSIEESSEKSKYENETDLSNKLITNAVAPVLENLEVDKSGIDTKKTFCCFCFEFKAVPSRHYEAVHSDEKEVKQFLAMKKRSAERMAMIEKLRLRGNNIHNLNKDFNRGTLLVTRQPRHTSIANAIDYRPCDKCGRWLLEVKRHKCPVEKDHYDDRSSSVKSKIMMGQIHENATELTRKILAINNDDETSEAVRYDPLLVVFVNDLAEKYTNQHQHKMIRARLRMLGSILLKMKEYNEKVFKNGRIHQKPNPVEVKTFADIINPKLYDNMIIAVQTIVGANAETSECRAPSTATTAGTWITKVAKVYEKELIKSLDYEKAKNVEYFLKVHAVEFPNKINTLARSAQVKQKRYKQELLPTMDDINCFRDYIESNLVSAYASLQKEFNYQVWKKLSQCTLIFVLLFNRKRPGELERIRIDDYRNAKKFEDTNKDDYERLSKNDKILVDEYLRLEFGGKKGREVPLLLSSGMQSFINTILINRKAAEVHENNPYIFGMPGFDGTRYKHLEACTLMRNFSKLCNAKHPERLRATELRKHFATTVASLNIDECQIYDISNFMGHAEKIHRDYYRQPVVTRDVCGVSQILEVASGVQGIAQRCQSISNSTTMESDASCSYPLKTSLTSDSAANGNEMVSGSDSDDSSVTAPIKNYQTNKRKLVSRILSDDESQEVVSTFKYAKKKKLTNNDTVSEAEKKRNNTKKTWSNEERELVLKTFASSIDKMKVPPTILIEKFLREHPNVERTPAQLRAWIHNQFAKQLRESKEKK